MDPSDLPSADEIQRPFADMGLDFVHPRNVARLAVALFDGMRDLHGLGADERRLIWCAGLLHDVGYAIDWRGHNKHSLRVIMDTETPALSPRDKRVVACVSRYHRGGSPKATHAVYAELTDPQQGLVRKLAAILRVADGLDRSQIGRVARATVHRGGPGHWLIRAYGAALPVDELWAAEKKADLFREVYRAEPHFEYAGREEQG